MKDEGLKDAGPTIPAILYILRSTGTDFSAQEIMQLKFSLLLITDNTRCQAYR